MEKNWQRYCHKTTIWWGWLEEELRCYPNFKAKFPQKHMLAVLISLKRPTINLLEELIRKMGGMDLIVISSGVGFINPDLNWSLEKEIIDVNVSGFTSMANVAFKYFCKQSSGHIVGISSIAAIRGGGEAPAYNASKAFVSNYMEGLRQKADKLKTPITVTEIQPGFVDTAMAKGEGLFWVASPEKAAW